MEEKNECKLAALYAALAKAQGAFAPLKKTSDGQVGHQKFKYADFAQIIESTRPSLTENGLSVVQSLDTTTASEIAVRTMILHAGGASIESTMKIPNPKFDRVQDLGKVISYLRRYAYSSILCLAAEDDIDHPEAAFGQQAGHQNAEPVQQTASAQKADSLPQYTDEELNNNFPTWEKAVKAGRTNPEHIRHMISSKAVLSPQQVKKINSLAQEG